MSTTFNGTSQCATSSSKRRCSSLLNFAWSGNSFSSAAASSNAGRLGRPHQLDRKGPVGPAVAVVLGHQRPHPRVDARVELRLQDRVVVALEQVQELVLKAPFHRVEVPGRPGRLGRRRRRLRRGPDVARTTPTTTAASRCRTRSPPRCGDYTGDQCRAPVVRRRGSCHPGTADLPLRPGHPVSRPKPGYSGHKYCLFTLAVR